MPNIRPEGAPSGAPLDPPAPTSSNPVDQTRAGPGFPPPRSNDLIPGRPNPLPPLYHGGRMPVRPGLDMVEERIDYDPATQEYVVTATYQARVRAVRDPAIHVDRIVVDVPPRGYSVTAEHRYRYERAIAYEEERRRYAQIVYPASTTVSVSPFYDITATAGTGTYSLSQWHQWNQSSYPPIPMSPEEQERRARKARKDKIAKEQATKRGRSLLLRCMNEEQQREYARTKMFVVEAADGRRFRLRKGKTAELLGPDGQATHTYCIHLSGTYIPEDNLIAQKLLLETDPASFERIANITALRIAPIAPPIMSTREAEHLLEYYRDARAMLRAEGIADPDAWIEGVRLQAQAAVGGVFEPAQEAGARGVAARAIYEEETFRRDQEAEVRLANLVRPASTAEIRAILGMPDLQSAAA